MIVSANELCYSRLASRVGSRSRGVTVLHSGFRGAYHTERAASLAGVPLSTVYYWARRGIYEPTFVNVRPILWSWSDLLALRAIYWLRQRKPELPIEATPMSQVRNLLRTLESLGDRLGDHLGNQSIVLRVDPRGAPHITVEGRLVRPGRSGSGQFVSPELAIDLLTEYQPGHGLQGPHLLAPRPRLRIIPGKLGGEPHITDTRIESSVMAALARRGCDVADILRLYPFLDSSSVDESLDLERQLQRNLAVAA